MIQELQLFKVHNKVGMLSPDNWMILSKHEGKSQTYYRVCLANATVLQAIGIINKDKFDDAVANGDITITGTKKVKIKSK